MPKNERGKYEVVDANGNPILDANGTAQVDQEVQPFPNSRVGANGVAARTNGNKPSAYIGGLFPPTANLGDGVRTQCDVGLQFEPTTYFGQAAGWSLFFYADPVSIAGANGNISRVQGNPRIYDPTVAVNVNLGKPWRSTSNPIAGTMSLDARPSGSAGFTFSALGTMYINPQRDDLAAPQRARWDVDANNHTLAPWGDDSQPAVQLFNPAQYAAANVKRVTAMTRDDPYTSDLDSSRVTAVWSACQVRPVVGGVFRTWVSSDVNQARTGYDVERVGDMAKDARFNGKPVAKRSQTIVQFASDAATNDDLRSPAGTGDARYSGESVTLNLGTLTKMTGSAVE